jgi:hypothetical protein
MTETWRVIWRSRGHDGTGGLRLAVSDAGESLARPTYLAWEWEERWVGSTASAPSSLPLHHRLPPASQTNLTRSVSIPSAMANKSTESSSPKEADSSGHAQKQFARSLFDKYARKHEKVHQQYLRALSAAAKNESRPAAIGGDPSDDSSDEELPQPARLSRTGDSATLPIPCDGYPKHR